MKKKAVGNWEIEVSSPYPSWTSISYDQTEIVRGLRLDELMDLRYAIDRALVFVREYEGDKTA